MITIREAWAGLNGGFGTIKMGSGLTPYDDVLGMDHLLLANGFEGLTTLGGGPNPSLARSGGFTNYAAAGPVSVSNPSGNACNASTNFDARYGSSIRYDSPSFSGLTFATHFAFLGENSTGFKCKGWDSGVIYKNGPIEGGLAYARHIDFQQYDGNAWRAHAGYDFGVAKILGAYERWHLDGNNGSTGEGTARYYSLGVVVPIGPGWFTAQYHNRNQRHNDLGDNRGRSRGWRRQALYGVVQVWLLEAHLRLYVGSASECRRRCVDRRRPEGRQGDVAWLWRPAQFLTGSHTNNRFFKVIMRAPSRAPVFFDIL